MSAAAAKQATTTIPIVMVVVADPVGAGFAASLARPGGNITGLSSDATPEGVGKQLEILHEVVPKVSPASKPVLRPTAVRAGSFAASHAREPVE